MYETCTPDADGDCDCRDCAEDAIDDAVEAGDITEDEAWDRRVRLTQFGG